MLSSKSLYKLIDDYSDRWMTALVPKAYPARGQRFPPIVLMALPKSGSVYLHSAIRRVLQIQMLKIGYAVTFGESLRYEGLVRLAQGNALIREHFEAKEFMVRAMALAGIRKMVVHVRDPRSAIVSWTRNMDRSVKTMGLAGTMLHCQRPVPAEYVSWDFRERLVWQIDHHLPRHVRWIEGWLDIIPQVPEIEFLVTTYEDFSRDNRGFVGKVLKFHDIDYKESWLKLPPYEVGKNNTFHGGMRDLPQELGIDILHRANALMPARLIERFNWPRYEA